MHSYGKGKAILLNADIISYLENRLNWKGRPFHQLIEQTAAFERCRPEFSVEDAQGALRGGD